LGGELVRTFSTRKHLDEEVIRSDPSLRIAFPSQEQIMKRREVSAGKRGKGPLFGQRKRKNWAKKDSSSPIIEEISSPGERGGQRKKGGLA